jgi:hypothetical protein
MIRPQELPNVIDALTRFKFKSPALAAYNTILTEKPAGILFHCRKTQRPATPQQEEVIISQGSASACKTYMELAKKKKWPEAEDTLAKDAEVSLWYAQLTQEPFAKGEAAIATNARYSFIYARDVLHRRFEAGEKAIREKKNSPNGKAILWESYCREFGVQ